MLIKSVKYKGKNLNCLKFKRIIGKDRTIQADNIHVIMTNVELMKMYELLHKRFGNAEQFMAVKVPKKKVAPKPVKKVRVFGTDIEVEV